LKQVEEELQMIADELKKVSTQSAKPKKTKQPQAKKKQPKQQQQQQQQEEDFEEEMPAAEGDGASGGVLASITGGIATGLQLLFTHRAVVLFGAAAFAIYTQGEMASV
jgi:hypothetical protein